MCQAACGIADKPRQVIEDIDKLDVNDELAVVEYIEDIYTFYKIAQVTATDLRIIVCELCDLLATVSESVSFWLCCSTRAGHVTTLKPKSRSTLR